MAARRGPHCHVGLVQVAYYTRGPLRLVFLSIPHANEFRDGLTNSFCSALPLVNALGSTRINVAFCLCTVLQCCGVECWQSGRRCR